MFMPPGMAEAMADKIDREILGPELQARLKERDEVWSAWWEVYGPKVLQEVAAKQAASPHSAPETTEEVTLERCLCMSQPDGLETPRPTCDICEGSGWWATKRILRPTPKPDFSEQAALAQLKTKDLHLLMAAKTIETAADLLERAGKAKDAAQTRQAGKAVRATVEGEN